MIVASAPGKAVISGEYAVLAGAPALIAAVNRRVTCTFDANAGDTWRFTSRGFAGESAHSLARLLTDAPLATGDPAHLCQCVLLELGAQGRDLSPLPRGADITIDSSPCYAAGTKLGLGSSAAVVVALTAIVESVTKGSDPSVTGSVSIALAAHARAQGGRGSGLDVATSHRGGLVRFRRDGEKVEVVDAAWPTDICYTFVSTGAAAATSAKLASFAAWRAGGTPNELRALCVAARRVADALSDPKIFVRELRAYVNCLLAMDDMAHLGIFSAPHRTLGTIASAADAIYKPCGAGGGDIGVAITHDRDALDTFVGQVRTAGFHPLSLELTQHGVAVGTKS
jgi:phosphomevalonate kinase